METKKNTTKTDHNTYIYIDKHIHIHIYQTKWYVEIKNI